MKSELFGFALACSLLFGLNKALHCATPPDTRIIISILELRPQILSISLGSTVSEVYSALGHPFRGHPYPPPYSDCRSLEYYDARSTKDPSKIVYVGINKKGAVISIGGSPLVVAGKSLDCDADFHKVSSLFKSLGAPEPGIHFIENRPYQLNYLFFDGKLEVLFDPSGHKTTYIVSRGKYRE